jgi:hypothetical protein
MVKALWKIELKICSEFSAEVEEKFIPRSTIGARETRVRCENLYVYALKRIMCLAAELAAHNVSEDNSGRRKIIRTSTEYLQFSLNVTTDLDAFCENITGEDDDLGPEYFGFIRVNYLTWQNESALVDDCLSIYENFLYMEMQELQSLDDKVDLTASYTFEADFILVQKEIKALKEFHRTSESRWYP